MLLVTVTKIQQFFIVPNRQSKPFNPLLGETYELVTDDFHFFSEMVSHHPPIVCTNTMGSGYEIRRCMETEQKMAGK